MIMIVGNRIIRFDRTNSHVADVSGTDRNQAKCTVCTSLPEQTASDSTTVFLYPRHLLPRMQ